MPHKIFFMHIAKTAGSYINHLFENSLGPDKVIVHGEVKIRNRENFCRLVESGVEFFSGHIYYRLWLEFAKDTPDQFKMITVLRDPIEHLASHILWLDHYNLPEKRRDIRDCVNRRAVSSISSARLIWGVRATLIISSRICRRQLSSCWIIASRAISCVVRVAPSQITNRSH